MRRGHVSKTQLSPEEKLTVAYSHLILGVDQHVLVAQFGVNQGRINEAITLVRDVLKLPGPEQGEEEA